MPITITDKTIKLFLLVLVLLAIGANALWVRSELKTTIKDHDLMEIRRDMEIAYYHLESRVDSLKSVVLRLDSISKAQKTTAPTQRKRRGVTIGKPISLL
jgi:hypothetical protein